MYPREGKTQGNIFMYLFLTGNAVSRNYSSPPWLVIPVPVLPPPLELMHLFVRLKTPEGHNSGSDTPVKKPNFDQWLISTSKGAGWRTRAAQGRQRQEVENHLQLTLLSGKTIPRGCMRYLGIRWTHGHGGKGYSARDYAQRPSLPFRGTFQGSIINTGISIVSLHPFNLWLSTATTSGC